MTKARLYTMDEASELLHTPIETLRYWRQLGKGPRSFKMGRRVFYAAEELELFVAQAQGDGTVPAGLPRVQLGGAMSDAKCARCGEKAKGYATIGNERYCHGDQDKPTCYMRESWERSRVRDERIREMDGEMDFEPSVSDPGTYPISTVSLGMWKADGTPDPTVTSAICDVCGGWASALWTTSSVTARDDSLTDVRVSRTWQLLVYACPKHTEQVADALTDEFGFAVNSYEPDALAVKVERGRLREALERHATGD